MRRIDVAVGVIGDDGAATAFTLRGAERIRHDCDVPLSDVIRASPMNATRVWVPNRRDLAWVPPAPDARALAFHRRLSGYAMTPLVELPTLAQELGVGCVFAKVESQRLGLPAFKALGASWAVRRVLDETGDGRPVTIVAATDGNHGRAVARFACDLGHRATVFVPYGVHHVAIEAIRAEGAVVVRVRGSYDDAVRAAAELGDEDGFVLVQDTAWAGYEDVPGWIVDGYETLFAELDDQLAAARVDGPQLVVVPTGVGSLLQAAIIHYRQACRGPRTAVVSVEPENAACVVASLEAGRPTAVTTGVTTMAGLNCGTLSTLAWPPIRAGLDAALVVDDVATGCAATALGELGVDAGPCGAASLAALRMVLTGPDAAAFLRHVDIGLDDTVVLVITESSAANPIRHE